MVDANKTLGEKLSIYTKFLMDEAGQYMSFGNYEVGLGESKSNTENDRKILSAACSNKGVGLINQGIFQGKQLDKEMYQTILKFLETHKDNIGDIELYVLSKNLIQPASFVTLALPIINFYHSAVGFIFKDKQGRVIRSAICQLQNLGPNDLEDVLERWFAPILCLFKVETKTGAKNPQNFSEKEFADNLHLDFTRTVSSLMFNFLETEDYTHDALIAENACLDLAEAQFPHSRLPSKEFFDQGIFRMQNYYDAYQKQRREFKKYQGSGDGTIFELAAYGPTPITSSSGIILHFSTLKNVSVFKDFLTFIYATYGNCSESIKDSDMDSYVIVGIDKVYSIPMMTNKEISKVLELPTIYSTDNGFIREMRGRATHCNIHVATIVTLFSTLSDSNKSIQMHTNFEDKVLQQVHDYMLNPIFIQLPLVDFAPGYEYGVDIHIFNNDPKYQQDKMEFARMWYVLKRMAGGNDSRAIGGAFSGASESMQKSPVGEVLSSILTGTQNEILQEVYKILFGKEVETLAKLTAASIIMLTMIMVLGEFKLYEHFYLITGTSTKTMSGEFRLNQTEQLPTVWKIPLTYNNNTVLQSYVKSFFNTTTTTKATSNESAGALYAHAHAKKNSVGDSFNDKYNPTKILNRFLHPLPLNKFYLWFPSLKANNTCSNVKLEGNLFLYILRQDYKLVDSANASALSLNTIFKTNSKKTSTITTTTIMITLVNIILIVITGIVWRELEQNKIFNSCIR